MRRFVIFLLLTPLLLTPLLLTPLLTPPARADFDSGLDAYARTDFATAMVEWQAAGNAGDALAQYAVGILYYEGQGVARDEAAATFWLRMAADQNMAEAQYKLGKMRAAGGEALEQDVTQAYVWFFLAAENGMEQPEIERDMLNGLLSPAELEEANRRLDSWHAGER